MKPGNEVECGIYIGWVKIQVEFEAVCGPKFMTFWHDIGDTLWLSTHLTDCLYRVSSVAVKLRSRPKKVVLGH